MVVTDMVPLTISGAFNVTKKPRQQSRKRTIETQQQQRQQKSNKKIIKQVLMRKLALIYYCSRY